VFVNGHTGKDNPQRQGLNSALSDAASPLNVLAGIPTVATDYSPLWDINPAVWTQRAIELGYRCEVVIPASAPDHSSILRAFRRGGLARVTILDHTVSLIGFTAASRGL
jgi:hypothetical protein